jgi:hypothetical protein
VKNAKRRMLFVEGNRDGSGAGSPELAKRSGDSNVNVDKQMPNEVCFYIPYQQDGIERLPERSEDFWPWLVADEHVVGRGKYTWTLQTFLNVREAGYPCRLVQQLPESGIVVSHRDFLPVFLRPRANLYVVCIKADRNRHSWADFHILQNESDPLRDSADGRHRSAALPFWPQPSLLPRDPQRGTRVENVAYLGRPLNLAEELRADSWPAELRTLGINWQVPERSRWNDYRNLDVTVSVRNFDTRALAHDPVQNVDSKPASKLVNSWIAGVPAILARESAYERVRRSPLDFIAVDSMTELRAALQFLRNDPAQYRDMVENGRERAAEFSAPAVAQVWVKLLEGDIASRYAAWTRRPVVTRILTRYWRSLGYFSAPSHIRSVLGALGPKARAAAPAQ